ncbi:MAG: transposon-encoded TnpW family protein [Oscillospiraceae bacterium]|nr:transposon-encoded TnpW family protein [Oscillospiraceae bacterium]
MENRTIQLTEENPSRIIIKLGRTTYIADIHFSQESKETMNDKIIRLVGNDIFNQICRQNIGDVTAKDEEQ